MPRRMAKNVLNSSKTGVKNPFSRTFGGFCHELGGSPVTGATQVLLLLIRGEIRSQNAWLQVDERERGETNTG